MLHSGMRTSSIFNTQHVATGWPNTCNMLHPTMLGYVKLLFKCYDLLAGACKCSSNNVGTCCVDISCDCLAKAYKGHAPLLPCHKGYLPSSATTDTFSEGEETTRVIKPSSVGLPLSLPPNSSASVHRSTVCPSVPAFVLIC